MSATPVPSSAAETDDRPSVRAILRVVVTVVMSALALYLIYRLRTPVSYIMLGAFVAIAASGPVNLLSRKLPRGLAIVLVYLGIVFLPIIIALIIVPPAVEQGIKLANKLPGYAQDLNKAFDENPQLKEANEKYGITTKLENVAENLVSRVGDAAGALVNIGAGLVSSLFALITILVISMFMIGRGRAWRDAALRHRPPHQAARIKKATNEIADAVGSYIGGALAQAFVAGLAAWIMLVILGVPSPLPLALIIALLDLIPLVGATLGAVVVGVVTLFVDFPTATHHLGGVRHRLPAVRELCGPAAHSEQGGRAGSLPDRRGRPVRRRPAGHHRGPALHPHRGCDPDRGARVG